MQLSLVLQLLNNYNSNSLHAEESNMCNQTVALFWLYFWKINGNFQWIKSYSKRFCTSISLSLSLSLSLYAVLCGRICGFACHGMCFLIFHFLSVMACATTINTKCFWHIVFIILIFISWPLFWLIMTLLHVKVSLSLSHSLSLGKLTHAHAHWEKYTSAYTHMHIAHIYTLKHNTIQTGKGWRTQGLSHQWEEVESVRVRAVYDIGYGLIWDWLWPFMIFILMLFNYFLLYHTNKLKSWVSFCHVMVCDQR